MDDASFARKLRYLGGGIESPIVRLFTTNRHLHVTCWMLVHSLSDVISPVLRDNLTFLVCHQLGSARIAKMIWDEWLSVKYPDFEIFANTLRWHLERPYGIMLLSLGKDPCIDLHMDKWKFLIPHLKFIVDLADKGKKNKKQSSNSSRSGSAKELQLRNITAQNSSTKPEA